LDYHPKNSGYITNEAISFVQNFNYSKPELIRVNQDVNFTPAPVLHPAFIEDLVWEKDA
jgi:hypothetical protein